MSKIITIRLTDKQYTTLVNEATQQKTTVSDYTRKKLFSTGTWLQWHSNKQLSKIDREIIKLPIGTVFTLPELLGYDWDKFRRGEKLILAKKYVQQVIQDNKQGDNSVVFIHDEKNDRNNRPKQFKKIRNRYL